MKNKAFKERQSFNDSLVFILLGAGFIGAIYGFIKAIAFQNYTLMNLLVYVGIAALMAICFWGLKRLRLKVSVNSKRIKYKLFPIHKEAQKIRWDDIASCEVVKTPPAAQWHGGNISFGRESVISLTGRNGLSIETKKGKRIFIGCKEVDDLRISLDHFRGDGLK